jgi:hypothetical protein
VSTRRNSPNTPSPATDNLPILLRAFVTNPVAKPRVASRWKPERPSRFTLVFDTETTTDPSQRLRFGNYQLRKGGALNEAGLFYDLEALSEDERRTLESFAASNGLKCMTHTEFVENVFFRRGYELRATIVGFNLPFDISRIALGWTQARREMRGGFSFKMSEKWWRPRVQVKHLSGRAAFIQFPSPTKRNDNPRDRQEGRRVTRRGSFVDVRTIAGALLSQSFDLGGLAKHLKTTTQKATTDDHGGVLGHEYLSYAVTDVQVTWECYRALAKRFAEHGLSLARMSQILSEASLGKAYLREMGVKPWRELQTDFPNEMLGAIMSSYFGGRAEVHLRRMVRQVLYCERAVAAQINASRNTLRRIVAGKNRALTQRLLRRIAAASHALKIEAAERRASSDQLREHAKAEIQKVGVAELARRLEVDPSNLRKAINGARELSLELQSAARRYRPQDY